MDELRYIWFRSLIVANAAQFCDEKSRNRLIPVGQTAGLPAFVTRYRRINRSVNDLRSREN